MMNKYTRDDRVTVRGFSETMVVALVSNMGVEVTTVQQYENEEETGRHSSRRLCLIDRKTGELYYDPHSIDPW